MGDETVTVTSESCTALLLDISSLRMVSKAVAVMKKTSLDLISGNLSGVDKSESCPFMDHLDKEKFADNYLRKRLFSLNTQKMGRTSSMDRPGSSRMSMNPAGRMSMELHDASTGVESIGS